MADMPTGTTMTYGWGPNGHPLVIAGQPTFNGTITNTIHWDGDDVLFTVDSSGNVELRAGELAMMMTSTGLDVLDRDMTGGLVGDHDGQGFSGWSAAPSFNTGGQKVVTAHGSFPVGSDSGNSGQFMQNRLDGYNDGYGNTFQGVRSQDSNTGQWSTPDAYAGDVHDPMSQKPYMYNHNNPFAYSDPSGYCANPGSSGTGACVDFFISASHALGLNGDNRGFTGDAEKGADSYRVQVNLDFAHHSNSNIQASHTHVLGIDFGKGHDQGSTISWSGNTATVHVSNRCGACPAGTPAIHSDFTATLNSNGSVTINGSAGRFPAMEAYKYSNGQSSQIIQSPESAGPLAPLGLTQTKKVSGTSPR
jgi:hypothetical protein